MSMERFSLAGKVAIVTGAGRGIGRAVALGLAEAGADVVVMARTAEQVRTVAAEIETARRRGLAIAGDVSRAEDINRCVAQTLDTFGQLDILVNNAAISPIYKRAERVTEEEWDAINAVNLKGTFLFCQAAGRVMIAQRRGKIINTASAGGVAATQRLSAYCTTKAGVIMLTKVLAVEWAQHNIQVNAIAPGWVATEFTAGLRNNPELYATLCAQSPLNRFAEPEEIAGMAVYLASESSNYVTGATMMVDGGITAW